MRRCRVRALIVFSQCLSVQYLRCRLNLTPRLCLILGAALCRGECVLFDRGKAAGRLLFVVLRTTDHPLAIS